jgi:hypothetical protein
MQRKGARTLLCVAAEIFSKKKGWALMVLTLPGELCGNKKEEQI